MKRQIFVAAAALAMAIATSAGSTGVTQQSQARAMDLDDCQLAHFASCMKLGGDYNMCYESAQSYACPG